jgi:SAM-dependent methyltransferase
MGQGNTGSGDFAYSGTDNLEMMAEAKNYNAYLVTTLAEHLRGQREVLDFGAGIGYLAGQLRDRGFSITCVEPDPVHARHLAGLGFPCLPSLPEAGDRRFSGAYALNVLEHIEDDAGVLRDLHQALGPDGVLVIYVPAFQVLFSAMDRKVGHWRRYRAGSLKRKLRAQGFQIIHCAYADVLGYAATLLYRLMGNRRGDLNPRGLLTFDRYVFPLSRWLDRLTSSFVGKNLWIVAQRRSSVR